MAEPQKILVPTDFSEGSEDALRYACDLARRLDASVTLLHVYQVPGFLLPEGAILAGPAELALMHEEIDQGLDRGCAIADDLGVEIVAQSACGAPSDEIVRVAEEQAFDLIVMSTHGRTGLGHVLLGSIAEQVLRHAPCPLLTTRRPAATA